MKDRSINLHDGYGHLLKIMADKISSLRAASAQLGDDVATQRTVIIADGQAYKVKETMEEVAALIAAIPEEQS